MAEIGSAVDHITPSVPESNGLNPGAESSSSGGNKKLSASEKRKQRARTQKLVQRAERLELLVEICLQTTCDLCRHGFKK
jgi:hypothetical protein